MLFKIRLFIFAIFISILTVFFSALALLAFVLPENLAYYLITRWSVCFIFLSKTICGLNYKVTGLENIPKQACVVVLNHQSMWETIFLQTLLPRQSWVLKRELLKIPFFGWGLALMQPIAIKRSNLFSIKVILEQGLAKLKAQRFIIIFPEGTRVLPGETKQYSKIAAALALHAKVPLLPIAHNAGKYWPRAWLPKQPGLIEVTIGPLYLEQKEPALMTADLKLWIEQHIKC